MTASTIAYSTIAAPMTVTTILSVRDPSSYVHINQTAKGQQNMKANAIAARLGGFFRSSGKAPDF